MLPFNKIIRTLIISDFIIYSGWGLFAPIFAIFVLESITGGSIQVVGFAVAIYWVLKSILQIPIGNYLDRNHGERDDYWFLVIGIFIASLVPLFFIIISETWHLYVLQAVYAVGMAMAVPSWGGIFVRHMDKGKEAKTWGAESSGLGIGIGIAGAIGGMVAATIGFTPLFIIISIFGMIGVGVLLSARNSVLSKGGKTMPISRP